MSVFDIMPQVSTYFIDGHKIDKIELIILRGKLSCYSPATSENKQTCINLDEQSE